MSRNIIKNLYLNKGIALISAVFIVVVLSLIAVFVVNIANMTHSVASMSVQVNRAFFAAKSGLEWGLHQIAVDSSACPADTTINYSQGGLNNFRAVVSCSVVNFTEGTTSYNVFELTATGSYGMFGDNDYVSRKLRILATLGV